MQQSSGAGGDPPGRALACRRRVFAIAANLLRCAPADLELRDGGVGVVGAPSPRMPEPICLRNVSPSHVATVP
jgi:hypothetical protein